MLLFSHGILGMNARNLQYIKRRNSIESILLADNKLKTKHFLSSRGIPFAETYFTISSQQELKDLSFDRLNIQSFVIKPNKGSRGRGILVVKKKKGGFLVQDEDWTEEELRLHMIDILHGSFSLHGSSDAVVIEECLSPGRDFEIFCQYGLADIRIIVYNYVPVVAMVRLPTYESGGKANLDLGALGLGVNIANGEIVSLYHKGKTYTHHFLPGYEGLKGKVIPFWDNILLLSSQVQMFSGLGFIGMDWVVTKNGPKLLEINARAGLKIQNVNLVPLESRLKKIEGLKVLSPEKGVEIAKTLFHTETISTILGKQVIYREQKGYVGGKEVDVLVNLETSNTAISEDIVEYVGGSSIALTLETGVHLDCSEFNITNATSQVILGTDVLKDFLIDPHQYKRTSSLSVQGRWTDDLLRFDDEVYRVGKKINLSSLLHPENYFASLDTFIKNPKEYNPIFFYRYPTDTKLTIIESTIMNLLEQAHKLKNTGFITADLYIEKLEEIQNKLELVRAYQLEKYDDIHQYNMILFGQTDPELLALSERKVTEGLIPSSFQENILGKALTLDEIVGHIHQYFENHHIDKIPITIESGNLSRMSVSYGKSVKIHVAKHAIIREKEIEAVLAHEIGTHFRRYLNGKNHGLKLLQYGTGYYLSDEEGFAIFRALSHLPEGYQKNAMYEKYYLLARADMLSFSETIELLRSVYPNKPLESIFSDAVRLKRGIIHSEARGIRGTTYQKDKIYLDGYVRVTNWIAQGGDPKRLFYGKIKIQDLKILEFL